MTLMLLQQGLPYLAGIVGACFGSFLNVCIYRMPLEGLSIDKPRWSFCPRCESRIKSLDNIPILSWLVLRARCRACRARIPFRYPLVEAITALLFVLAVVQRGDGTLTPLNFANIGFWCALYAALIVVTFIDMDHRLIPDDISVTGAALIPIAAWFLPEVPIDPALPLPLRGISSGNLVWENAWLPGVVLVGVALVAGAGGARFFRRYSRIGDEPRTWWETRLAASVVGLGAVYLAGFLLWEGWTARSDAWRLGGSLLGMATGAATVYGVLRVGKWVFRKDAMGFGDVKLMAMLGAVLGWKGVLLAFFLACLLGSVVGIAIKILTRSSYMPFGPYLCAGALTMILARDWVEAAIDWYMALFR